MREHKHTFDLGVESDDTIPNYEHACLHRQTYIHKDVPGLTACRNENFGENKVALKSAQGADKKILTWAELFTLLISISGGRSKQIFQLGLNSKFQASQDSETLSLKTVQEAKPNYNCLTLESTVILEDSQFHLQNTC